MKNNQIFTYSYRLFLTFSLLLTVFFVPIVYAEATEELFSWDVSFGEEERKYSGKAFDMFDNSIFIAGVSSNAGMKGERPLFWLWELDTKGKKIKAYSLSAKNRKIQSETARLTVLRVLKESKLALIIEPSNGDPELIITSFSGERLLSQRIKDYGFKGLVFINQVLVYKDQSLLLLGRSAGLAIIINVKLDGSLLWKKIIDLSESNNANGKIISSFVDGVIDTKGDGFIAVANASEYNKSHFHAGPSTVQLIRFDKKGHVIAKKSLRGRYGSIASLNGNRLGLVWDLEETAAQETVLAILNESFMEIKRIDLDKQPFALKNDFYISSHENGDFLVSGNTGSELLIIKFDTNGVEKFRYQGQGANESRGTRGVSSGNGDFYVLTSIMGENSKRQYFYRVGLIKIP
jgi:hypothetical protein